MAEKKYSQEKESLKKFSENIPVQIGKIRINIWKTISLKLNTFIKQIKQNPDLDEAAKVELLYFIYSTINNDLKNYVPTNNQTWIFMVQEFLESKCNASWTNYMDNYFVIFNEKIKSAVTEAKQRNKRTEEKKVEEEKEYKFIDLRNIVLKRLGYVSGKKGSQNNSKEIEPWMLENGGLTKSTRNLLIKGVRTTSNNSQLLTILKKNRLELKDEHLVRSK